MREFDTAEQRVFSDVLAQNPATLPGFLDGLLDDELQAVQRMAYATGATDLKAVVEAAVLRRPHRGCWPIRREDGADGG